MTKRAARIGLLAALSFAFSLLVLCSPSGARTVCQGCVVVPTAAHISIVVDRRFASRFQRLIAELVRHGYKPRSIVCYARGHTYGSNHDGGGACDIDQRARNKTARMMYHARALIQAAGLFDGCTFRDCGHVEAIRGLCNYGQCHGRTLSAKRRHRTKHATVLLSASLSAQY